MGDNIYISFWRSKIQEVITHFELGETRIIIDVAGLSKFGNRQSYYSKFKIIKGQLEISKNAYAQGRDFHDVLVNTDYFKTNLYDSVLYILITKDLQLQIEMENTHIPEFFTQKDFDMLAKFAGKSGDRQVPELSEAYDYLRGTYSKVDYWAIEVCKQAFPGAGEMAITRKPTNQANKFEAYQWAKIYPSRELLEWKNLAYTLTFSDRQDFCIKIDTVRLHDNDPLRRKYLAYLGDFFKSPIVKLFKAEEVLPTNWTTLIDRSVATILQLKSDYEKLLKLLGYSRVRVASSASFGLNSNCSLNTILYGPPGTGKTYKIMNNYYPFFTSNQEEVSEDQYRLELVGKYTWWQVVAAVTLDLKSAHVTEILNHPILQAKDSLSNQKNVRAMIWAMLQTHTILECENVNYSKRSEPLFFNKDKDGTWSIDIEIVRTEAPEIIELLESWRKPIPENKEVIKRFEFVTFHQSFSYEDFVEGIKPIMDEEGEDTIGYRIEDGIFKRLCTKARRDPENNYALFIDEINRGNVSQIFGELITLIEDDKREGKKNIGVELPYSKTKFSVPSNLYIIGTMNTADRSVEALDTALRRRFSFIEMPPLYHLAELQTKVEGFAPADILQKINLRLEKLLDKDHLIGHSYFLEIEGDIDKLKLAFQHKIIPLLQEYFYGDIAKIGLVLGKGFFKVIDEEDEGIFADFEYDTSGLLERKVYHLINWLDEDNQEFMAALNELLK